MLDITFIRDNSDLVKKACSDKQLEPELVTQLLQVDEKRRTLTGTAQDIRGEINQNADKIKNQVSKGSQPDPQDIEKGKNLKKKLKAVEPELKSTEEKYLELMLAIPNVPAPEVPVGADESSNEVIKTHGNKPEFDFKPKSHHELMENLDMLDTKRAARISGFRSYFLKNDGLLLEQAILQYALKLMIDHGFTPMSAPVLVNREALVGTGYFPWGESDHYVTQDKTILTGTAEVALTAYHTGETLKQKDLPIKMVGLSTSFRREVGAHGKDTKGVFRVHQFNKVEQVVYTVADEKETQKWHEKMLAYSEELLQGLGLPYQVVMMCTGDMGAGQRKKYDIDSWFPGQNKYRETHSASYFNDFQSRRLNIRYQAKDGSLKHVYTLNNTVAATPRLLAAIVENYQTKDRSVVVPKVLQKSLDKKIISSI